MTWWTHCLGMNFLKFKIRGSYQLIYEWKSTLPMKISRRCKRKDQWAKWVHWLSPIKHLRNFNWKGRHFLEKGKSYLKLKWSKMATSTYQANKKLICQSSKVSSQKLKKWLKSALIMLSILQIKLMTCWLPKMMMTKMSMRPLRTSSPS